MPKSFAISFKSFGKRSRQVLAAVAALCLIPPSAAGTAPAAAPPIVTPSFWDPNHEPQKPDLSSIREIRFLTDDDFPPFNFVLASGELTGFNVDLARAICAELALPCTIQRRAWELLLSSLEDGSGDAVIASLAINAETRKGADFTTPYLLTPGRFAMRSDTVLASASPETIDDRPIAVVAGSRHEAFLKVFYPKATLVPFETAALARRALVTGRVQALFGDAITTSYWLNGAEAKNCCAFKDEAFTDPRYFGDGVGIALRKGNKALRRALDYALWRLAKRGAFGDIYLKYFPIGPF